MKSGRLFPLVASLCGVLFVERVLSFVWPDCLWVFVPFWVVTLLVATRRVCREEAER